MRALATVLAVGLWLGPANAQMTMTGAGSGGFGGGGGGATESMFGTATPTYALQTDGPIETGFSFVPNTNGHITAVRFYKDAGDTGTHTGTLWDSVGTNLATVTFTGETASGWQQMNFASPVSVTAGSTYMVSVHHPGADWIATNNSFPGTWGTTHVAQDTHDDWFIYGASAHPTTFSTFSANYWVDFVYTTP